MTVGYDSYQRPFAVNLAAGFHVAPRRSLQAQLGVPENSAQVVLADSQARLSLTTDQQPDNDAADLALRARGDLRMPADHRADVNLEADLGRLSFQAWTGQNGMPAAPGLGAGENAFAMLAQPDHAGRAGYRLGPSWTIAAEAGGGSAYSLYGFTDLAPSHYDLAEVRFTHGPLTATFSAGELIEPEGPLGSFLPRGSSDALPAQTAFSTARLDWTAADWLVVSAEGGVGRTRASGAFLDLSQPAVSSQWALSARTLCPALAPDCLRFDVRLGQPTRIEGGTFTAVLGQIPTSDSQIVEFTPRQFSATPSGREFDLSFGLARGFSRLGELELRSARHRRREQPARHPAQPRPPRQLALPGSEGLAANTPLIPAFARMSAVESATKSLISLRRQLSLGPKAESRPYRPPAPPVCIPNRFRRWMVIISTKMPQTSISPCHGMILGFR